MSLCLYGGVSVLPKMIGIHFVEPFIYSMSFSQQFFALYVLMGFLNLLGLLVCFLPCFGLCSLGWRTTV
jgi:hypothetical protein